MKKKEISKSLRKYFRREKARIRREFLSKEKQKKLIKQLYLDKGIKLENDKQ